MAAAAIPLIASGISALGGYLANRKAPQQTSQNTTTVSSGETQPNYDAQMAALKEFLWRSMADRVSSPFESTGYLAGGMNEINRTADNSTRLLEALLSQRGLARTGMGAGAIMGNQINRWNQLSKFKNQIPLLSDQWKQSNIAQLADFFTKLPVGNKTNSTQNTTGAATQTNPGNPTAGALQSGASMLSYLYGQGAFGKGNNTTSIGPTDMGYNVSVPGYAPTQSFFNPQNYYLGGR